MESSPWIPVIKTPYLQSSQSHRWVTEHLPDSKVHGANMGPIWGWQDPGGTHVGLMKLVIWAQCQLRSLPSSLKTYWVWVELSWAGSASVSRVNISSWNGLLLPICQTIITSKLLTYCPSLWNKPQWSFNKNTRSFFHANAFQNLVAKMCTFLMQLSRVGSGLMWAYHHCYKGSLHLTGLMSEHHTELGSHKVK